MRILLLHDYGTPTGGAEYQLLSLRDGLRARGHHVRLLSSRASLVPGPVLADDTCFGTTRGRLQVVSQTVNPSARRALRDELADFRPDVVHVRMFLHQLSPLILPLLRDVPTVFQAVEYKAICPRGTKLFPDGTRCDEPAGRACLKHDCVTPQSWVLHMAQMGMVERWRDAFDAVVGLSDVVKERYEENGWGPVEVIPNGVPVRDPRPPLDWPPTVAFAGRLVHTKGVDRLLAAFATVVSDVPDARLLIAGAGPDRELLETTAGRLGLADRVTFLGHLTRPKLEEHFDGAWVQVAPGLWEEPFGNVVTEAMMRGTAVVASAVGGPAGIVREGETGLLVPPGDVGALATALRLLLTDRDRAEALGARGHEVAIASYSEQQVVTRFETLYERLSIAAPLPSAPSGPTA